MPHPKRNQGGQNAGEEHRPPAEARHHQRDHTRTQCVANRPGALHQRKRLAAVLRRPGLGDQGSARGPFPTHAEAQQHTADHQLRGCLRETAQSSADGINQHAPNKRPHPAKPVGKPAEAHPAGCRGNERGRHHRPTHCCGEMHLPLYLAQDQCVEHHVHAVEHVPKEGRKQGAPLFARGFSQPAINAVQTMSLVCRTSIRCLRCYRSRGRPSGPPK